MIKKSKLKKLMYKHAHTHKYIIDKIMLKNQFVGNQSFNST